MPEVKKSTGLKYANDAMQSPARALIFDNEGKINNNVAIAMDVGIRKYISERYLDLMEENDVEDIQAMFGLSEIPSDAVLELAKLGKLHKFEVERLGNMIFKELGLALNKTAPLHLTQGLIADLGNTGMLIARDKGYIQNFDSRDVGVEASALGRSGQSFTKLIKLAPDVDMDVLRAENLEMSAMYGVDVDTSRTYDLVPPKGDRKVDIHNQPFTEANEVQAKTINKLEKVAYGTNEGVAELKEQFTAAELKEALGFKAIAKDGYIMVKNKDTDKMEKKFLTLDSQIAQKGKNREISESVERLYEMPSVDVWFKWFLTKGGRFNLDSTTVNPQSDKLHRFLVTPKSFDTEVDMANEEDARMFKLAVAQAFGMKVDKRKEKKMLDAVDKLLAEDIENITEKAKEAEHIGHAMVALAAIKKYKKGGKFNTSLSLEVDGITNGFSFKMMQTPLAGYEKWLAKVGFLVEGTEEYDAENMAEVFDLDGFFDTYETLGAGYEPADAKMKHMHDVLTKNKMLPDLSKVGEKVSGAVRNMMKSPVMTFNYSAGIASIMRHVSEDMIASMRDDLLSLSAEDFAMVAGISVQEVGQFKQNLKDKPMLYSANIRVWNNLKGYFHKAYAEPLGAALEETFGEYIELNNSVNMSFNLMFDVFNSRVDAAKTPDMSEQGRMAIIKENLVYAPLIASSNSSKLEDGVLVYSRATETLKDKNVKTKLADGSTSSAGVVNKGLGNPGAAGAVIPTHIEDGGDMGSTVLDIDFDMTPVHDAEVLGLKNVNEGAMVYNKNWYESNRQHSILQSLIDAIERVKTQAKADGVDLSKYKVRKKIGKEMVEFTLEGELAKLKGFNKIVQANRKTIFSSNAKIGQMNGPVGSMYEVDIKEQPAIIQGKKKELRRELNSTVSGITSSKTLPKMDGVRRALEELLEKTGCLGA